MKKWKSCARWKPDLVNGDVTTDMHDTREQAEGVCKLLKREGFGGEGKDFPIMTWNEYHPNGVDVPSDIRA